MRKRTVPTWAFEAMIVALPLGTVAAFRGQWIEWVGAAAVLASFMHAQVADRMAEKQSAMAKPDVTCFRWTLRYFVMKEGLWFAYFVALGAWSALVGVLVFLLYPIWRQAYRARVPMKVAP
jgi:hypothetical protein